MHRFVCACVIGDIPAAAEIYSAISKFNAVDKSRAFGASDVTDMITSYLHRSEAREDSDALASEEESLLLDTHKDAQENGSDQGDFFSKPSVMSFGHRWRRQLAVFVTQTKVLFRSQLLRPSIILICVWFLLAYGFYGTSMWLPEYFHNFESVDVRKIGLNCLFQHTPVQIVLMTNTFIRYTLILF